MSSPARDKERVFQDIQTWPIEDLLELAQSALRRASLLTRAPEMTATPQLKDDPILGLIKTDQPPVDESDEEILVEELMKKYGL